MPKVQSTEHCKVKVGMTMVEFVNGEAEVTQEVANVLLSLTGENNLPEYFLVEEPLIKKEEAKEEAKEEPKKEEEKREESRPSMPQAKQTFQQKGGRR